MSILQVRSLNLYLAKRSFVGICARIDWSI